MEPSCDPASSMAMDAAVEHTAVDDKDELIACLNEQVAQQKELIVKQAQELSAAKLQAHKNKVDYHCMHSKVDNLLANAQTSKRHCDWARTRAPVGGEAALVSCVFERVVLCN